MSARERQHGAYELGQPARLTFDVAEEEIAVGRLLRAGLEDVGCAHDRGQRRLELVGGVGDEVPLSAFVVVPPGEIVKSGDGGDDLTGLVANGSGAHLDEQPLAVWSENFEALGRDDVAEEECARERALRVAGAPASGQQPPILVIDGHVRLAEDLPRLVADGQRNPCRVDGDEAHRELADDSFQQSSIVLAGHARNHCRQPREQTRTERDE